VSISKKTVGNAGRLLRRCAAGMAILAIVVTLFIKQTINQQHQAWANVQAASQVVGELERLSRGLNEVVVTEGSSASEKVVKTAIATVDKHSVQLSLEARELIANEKWRVISERARRLAASEGVNSDDVQAMIDLGKLTTDIGKLQAQLDTEEQRLVALVEQSKVTTNRVLGGAAIAIFLGAAMIFWLFHIRIANPLERASQAAALYAQGDLTQALKPKQGGEVQFLYQSMESMRQELSRLAQGIRDTSSNVASAALEARQSNDELSIRFQGEAASIEQTASTLRLFAETLANTATDTQHAQTLTKASTETTRLAAAVVEETVGVMKGLGESSEKINSISLIIDEIATKTNLLALNASIEASRSGSAGRGFSVIAQEVGRLAQSCSVSAGQIKDLIANAAQDVHRGTSLVNRVGESMEKVSEANMQIDTLIEAVANRATDQSNSVEEISAAVAQIDISSRINLDQVQALGKSANSLESQAHQLKKQVDRFTLS
jgi:methyl-accepting chemotaxis protein